MALHSPEPWRLAKDPKDRVSQSATELCVMLDIPEHARKQIHGWVLEQDWPEGTELHEPEEYHITLMYTPSGYEEHRDADWIDHMDSAKVRITGIDVFPRTPEDRYPYVLRLDAPDVKAHATEMQRRAEEDHDLEITHFDGGYRPHITVGYGPEDTVGADDVVELEFEAGPSIVSEPREDEDDKTPAKEAGALPERGEESAVAWKLGAHVGDTIHDIKLAVKAPLPPKLRDASGKDRCGNCKMFDRTQEVCWGFGNRGKDDDPPVTEYKVCNDYYPAPGYHESKLVPATYGEAQLLDDLSLRSVAHNLHYKFEEGGLDSPEAAKSYAERLLGLIGYPSDDMNTLAALQAWQTTYPQDQPRAAAPSAPEALQAPPTTPTESWGYGTVSGLTRPIHFEHGRRRNPHHAGVHHGPTDVGPRITRRRRRQADGLAPEQQPVPVAAPGGWAAQDGQPQPGDSGAAGGPEDGVGLLAGSRTARRSAAGWTSPELDGILDAFNRQYGATVLADETPAAVSFNHIEIPPQNRGNGVGHRLMNQLKAYVDRTGKGLQVRQVVNFPFFAQFPWLQAVPPDNFVYEPAMIGADVHRPTSTEPTAVNNPDDRWPDWGGRGEDERHHYDINIGNDWQF